MKRSRLLLITMFIVAVAMLAGCQASGAGAAGTQQVNIQATEFKFTPSTVTVKAGSPVEIMLHNTGTQTHDWTVDDLEGKKVQVVAQPGQTGSVTFTPTRPGTYQFYCSQPGHKDAGMVGQLTVQ